MVVSTLCMRAVGQLVAPLTTSTCIYNMYVLLSSSSYLYMYIQMYMYM